MKKFAKFILAAAAVSLISTSVFADPPKKSTGTSQALAIVEAFQTTFRSISETLLPSVVEVDVTETKTYTDPFGGMTNPFEFFFGSPRGDDGKNQREADARIRGRPADGRQCGLLRRRAGGLTRC